MASSKWITRPSQIFERPLGCYVENGLEVAKSGHKEAGWWAVNSRPWGWLGTSQDVCHSDGFSGIVGAWPLLSSCCFLQHKNGRWRTTVLQNCGGSPGSELSESSLGHSQTLVFMSLLTLSHELQSLNLLSSRWSTASVVRVIHLFNYQMTLVRVYCSPPSHPVP